MSLPLPRTVSPMLAKAVAEVPAADAVPGGYGYEPKWDGFRCIVIRDGDEVELASRGAKPLTRYFPEVVERVLATMPAQCMVDAEIVVRTGATGAEHLDWDLLSQRIHPAQSRITLLSRQTPAELVCFDLLALGDDDLTGQPFAQRRAALLDAIPADAAAHGVHVTAMTTDAAVARQWFTDFEGAGLDGVMAKPLDGAYQQGKRAMLKIKHKRTAEAVITGYRIHKSGSGVGSLLLGLYDDAGRLLPVGGIAAFTSKRRLELIDELEPYVVRDADGQVAAAQTERSRFSGNKDVSFVPLRHELVVEVAFDQLEKARFRHAVTFLRMRPDREPRSCLIDQVDRAPAYDLAQVLDAR